MRPGHSWSRSSWSRFSWSRLLVVTVFLLIAAAAALGGAATVGWARAGFLVPLRGTVPVRVSGADLLPALGPVALLALAAVAAMLGTGGWLRQLLGGLLVAVAVLLAAGVVRVTDAQRVSSVAAAGLPARSVLDGTVTVLVAGPGLAVAGAVLLAGAGTVLMLRGHRMPRLGRRYRAPVTRPSASQERQMWERIDAGEDPTVPDDPR